MSSAIFGRSWSFVVAAAGRAGGAWPQSGAARPQNVDRSAARVAPPPMPPGELLFRDGDFAVLRDAYTGSVAVASRTEVTTTPPLTLV